ncbi:MAG: hypothetical protein FJ011_16445 [Chloroflexi bacterium]|nr:hypothetical protein [Chloroflexota bacterium]
MKLESTTFTPDTVNVTVIAHFKSTPLRVVAEILARPYLPLLLVSPPVQTAVDAGLAVGGLSTPGQGIVIVTNTGAYVYWEYNGVAHAARSNPVVNGEFRRTYLPMVTGRRPGQEIDIKASDRALR